MKRFIVVILAASLLVSGAVVAQEHRISMLPRYYPERLVDMMSPLVEHVREATGLDLQLILAKDFRAYEERLASGEIAIGYSNPLVYTRVSRRHQVVAMAVKGEGGDRFRGILIARPDSGIRGLEDLPGKRVMIVAETSAGGWLSQKLSMLEQGIALDEVDLVEAADNRQENVIIAVSVGDVDAGFIRESALHVADKYIAPGSVESVTATAWLPNWAFSVDRDLPPGVREALQGAVVGLEAGHPVLEAMGLTGFRAAEDGEYDPVRKALGSE